ncbi:CDP-diacylglycerol--serine O-phosphatidyltransferase [bacterium]|nr:CDP-diacylglycerol--serine O-phosphatidyltransferase [bacterium]
MNRKAKLFIPGFFTLANMACGFFSILYSFRNQGDNAAWMIILASFLDLLDGRIARVTHSTSDFGMQLDSFSDLVSFGVAPAVLLYSLDIFAFGRWGGLVGLVFMASGAFRLARFNLTANLERKTQFIGLPIPWAAICIASYVILSLKVTQEIMFPQVLVGMVILLSWLMVSTVKYDAVPHLSLKEGRGQLELVMIILTVVLVLYNPQIFLFPFILMYIFFGIAREIRLIFIKKGFEGSTNERL